LFKVISGKYYGVLLATAFTITSLGALEGSFVERFGSRRVK
jgi:hypothetical protein